VYFARLILANSVVHENKTLANIQRYTVSHCSEWLGPFFDWFASALVNSSSSVIYWVMRIQKFFNTVQTLSSSDGCLYRGKFD